MSMVQNNRRKRDKTFFSFQTEINDRKNEPDT